MSNDERHETPIEHIRAYPREFAVLFAVTALVIVTIWLSYLAAEWSLPHTALAGEEQALRWGWLVGVFATTSAMLVAFRAYRWFIKELGVNYAE